MILDKRLQELVQEKKANTKEHNQEFYKEMGRLGGIIRAKNKIIRDQQSHRDGQVS